MLERAVGSFQISALPYVPGSVFPVRVDALPLPLAIGALGPIALHGDTVHVPSGSEGARPTLVAGNAVGEAMRSFGIAGAPRGDVVAVASYEDGVVFHDPKTLRAQSVLGIAGSAAGVTIAPDGSIATGDTAGDGVTIARRDPWSVRFEAGVPQVDELAFAGDGTLYATERGTSDRGTVVRLAIGGTRAQAQVGNTPEGVAVSADGSRVYVANVNDGTVSVLDGKTMRELSRTKIVDRAFTLTLSRAGDVLYVVSNQSVTSPFAQAGSVVAVATRGRRLRVVRSSAPLAFPLGAALDERDNRLFVTDESLSVVYVLDSRTLRQAHEPLSTCRTPWEPHVDELNRRLYVPCARADAIDVFDVRTLARMHGAPFATGGYPLSVATWHGKADRVR